MAPGCRRSTSRAHSLQRRRKSDSPTAPAPELEECEVKLKPITRSKSTTTRDKESFDETRTVIDFWDDDSIPCLTVRTFLSDCCRHPKILCHKEFKFFRDFLKAIGFNFEISEEAPYEEDHEDNSFCVDIKDDWVPELQERVEAEIDCEDDEDEEEDYSDSEDNDFYWAKIIPIERKSEIGLIIFKWEPLPLSVHFIETYTYYCRGSTKIPKKRKAYDVSSIDVDEHIKNFIEQFDLEASVDVEIRLQEDNEAKEMRRQRHPSGISPTKLSRLLKLHKCKEVWVQVEKLPPLTPEVCRRLCSKANGVQSSLKMRKQSFSSGTSDSNDSSSDSLFLEVTPKKAKVNGHINKNQCNISSTQQMNGLRNTNSHSNQNERKRKRSTATPNQSPTLTRFNLNLRFSCDICQTRTRSVNTFPTRELLLKHLVEVHQQSPSTVATKRSRIR